MTPSEPSIRRYDPADEAACRALWVELTQRHRDIYDDQTIGGDDPGEAFPPYLAGLGNGELWVVDDDGELVAMAGLLVHGEEGEVEPIVVTESHRSQGIGGTLLEHMVGRARDRGTTNLSIRPVARNVEAIDRFYEFGFRALGHVDLFMTLRDSDLELRPGVTLHGHEMEY